MPSLTFRPGTPVAACLILAAVAAFGACSSSHHPAATSGSGTTTSTGARTGGSGATSGGATSTSAPVADAGSSTNPCTIVTASDAAAILGATATATGPTEKNRGVECLYKNATSGGFVLVQVYQGKEFYDPSMQAPKAKKLTGIGDDAYFDDFGTTRSAVGFLKGDVAVFIDGDDIASPDAVVSAAKSAAAKV